MSNEAINRCSSILKSGYIGQGPVVDEFESKLRDYFNTQYLVTLNSATSGISLALHLLKNKTNNWPGINEDDEILTTPLTCFATNAPIINNNLNLKWVDVDLNTCNINLDDLERKITNKTKAIIIVHWGGTPVNLDHLNAILDKSEKLYGFRPMIIEDCAHALGSTFNNKPIGSYGNICIFSFQAIKHITSIDGGLLILPNSELYERAKLLRWYGISREDKGRTDFRCEEDILEAGFKYHMNDVCAGIGLENFKYLNEIVDKQRNNAKYYLNNLTCKSLSTDINSSYWLYTISLNNRNDIMLKLKNNGIMSSRVHERNDKHSCMSKYKCLLPNLDYLTQHMLCIPVGWWITEDELKLITKIINEG